jgi:hypothetical protein
MNAIQLDEDCDAAHLERACQLEGKVTALRFPRQLKGMKDPEVLQRLIPQAVPILTLDRGFAEENQAFVPDSHAGIVILALDDDALRTMTTKLAQRMLADIKGQIPEWDSVDISNSILVIRNSTIEVYRCRSHLVILDVSIDRNIDGWIDELLVSLHQNASPLA